MITINTNNRSAYYRFTTTDKNCAELKELSRAISEHNQRLKDAWGIAEDKTLLRIDTRARGPRRIAEDTDGVPTGTYHADLPHRHATHFDVYVKPDFRSMRAMDKSVASEPTTVQVSAVYQCWVETPVELPKGYTSDDIDEIFIKWDEGLIVFKDGTELEFSMDEDATESHDFKRPDTIKVFNEDFSNVIGEYS